jgi:hypothetical protein
MKHFIRSYLLAALVLAFSYSPFLAAASPVQSNKAISDNLKEEALRLKWSTALLKNDKSLKIEESALFRKS